MLWLYIHFPSLQLDCLQTHSSSSTLTIVEQQHLNEQAVVIVEDKKNRIVQLNTRAKEKGIKQGMGLGLAASLAHDLCVVPYQIVEEHQYLHTLAEQLYKVTANIAIFPPQGLALQVNDMLMLYNNLPTYVDSVNSVLKPFNLHSTFACANNVMAAQVLACAGINLITTKTNVMEKKMATISVDQLFIHHKVKESLARLGIKSLVQLQALPIKSLAKRIDSNTLEYLAQLKGKINPSLDFYQPKHYFKHSVELLYEMRTVKLLLQPIKQLLLLLELFLQRRDYVCLQLEFHLYHRAYGVSDGFAHSSQQSFIISSATGEYLSSQWLNLVTLKLTTIKLVSPITKVSLFVDKFQENTGEIDDIFLGKKGQLSFAQLASLLVNKLGNEKIQRLQQGNDHRAELSCRYIPYISASANELNIEFSHISKPMKLNQASKKTFLDKLPLRPSFILSEPEPLSSHINILHGPERIVTAWWQQVGEQKNKKSTSIKTATHPHYQRDYYIAKNALGQCCWVYKNVNNQWYIHGYFS